jgi:hypothetical protein
MASKGVSSDHAMPMMLETSSSDKGGGAISDALMPRL